MAGLLDGSRDVPGLAGVGLSAGVDLGSAVVLPPGGQVFYVRGTGGTSTVAGTVTEYSYDPPGLRERLNGDVNTALRQCVSGRGDVVVVLPGHTETVSAADGWSNLVAGTRIIGLSTGFGNRPTITFNNSASTILADVANVTIEGFKFLFAGALASTTALTVTVAIPVTAAGFIFRNNYCNVGVDADQLVTDMMTLSAGADQCTIINNHIEGYAASVITTVIKTSAAGADDLTIANNIITAEVATAATGVLIDIDAGAILRTNILGNILENQTASSKYVIDGHATSTGRIHGNLFLVLDGATGPASLGIVGCDAMRTGLNYCSTAVVASAIVCPAVDS